MDGDFAEIRQGDVGGTSAGNLLLIYATCGFVRHGVCVMCVLCSISRSRNVMVHRTVWRSGAAMAVLLLQTHLSGPEREHQGLCAQNGPAGDEEVAPQCRQHALGSYPIAAAGVQTFDEVRTCIR